MPPTLKLPGADGTVASYTLSGRAPIQAPAGPIKSRIGMAAVHVVADPRAAINPTLEVALDWDATLRLPALSVVAGPGRRGSHGHLAAGDGLRLDDRRAS